MLNMDKNRLNAVLDRLYRKSWYIHVTLWILYLYISYKTWPMFAEELPPLLYLIFNVVFVILFFYLVSLYIVVFFSNPEHGARKVFLGMMLFLLASLVKAKVSFVSIDLGYTFSEHFIYEMFRVYNFGSYALSTTLPVLIIILDKEVRQLAENVKSLKIGKVLNRLSPHFLNNSLTSLLFNTYKESPALYDQVYNFSEVVTYGIGQDELEVVLNDEIQQVTRLVEAHKYNKGGVMHVNLQVDVEKEYGQRLKIPRLVLPTLVENIFIHGVVDDVEFPASITIRLLKTVEVQERLYFQVIIKNKVNNNNRVRGHGMGLESCRDLLENTFKNSYTLISTTYENTFCQILNIDYGSKL